MPTKLIDNGQLTVNKSKSKFSIFNFQFSIKSQGFTLIELMVVIAIIGILAAVGFATYSNSQMLGRDAKRKQDLRSIQTALEVYYQRNGGYPSSGSGWQEGCTASVAPTCSPNPWISGLDGSYINILPQESYNLVSAYKYYSTDPSCYLLVSFLENQADGDLNGSKPQNAPTCMGSGSLSPTYDQYFVIVSP